MYRKQKVLPEP